MPLSSEPPCSCLEGAGFTGLHHHTILWHCSERPPLKGATQHGVFAALDSCQPYVCCFLSYCSCEQPSHELLDNGVSLYIALIFPFWINPAGEMCGTMSYTYYWCFLRWHDYLILQSHCAHGPPTINGRRALSTAPGPCHSSMQKS